jgi:hypothetical protein
MGTFNKNFNTYMKDNFEVTLHFERENLKLPFPMKYKQPFKFIPWLRYLEESL